MTEFVLVRSEEKLWTVGHYDPDGRWISHQDHGSKEEAYRQVHYLNGWTISRPDEGCLNLGELMDLLEKAKLGSIAPGELLALMSCHDAFLAMVRAWEYYTFHCQQELAVARSTQLDIQEALVELEARAREEEPGTGSAHEN